MVQITYRSNPADPLVPQAGKAIRSEVVRENFQILQSGSTLWAHDTVYALDPDVGEGIVSTTTTATVTYLNHPFSGGELVIVTGAVETDYNGVFTIAYVDANTFTYTMAGDPTSPATTDGVIEIRLARQVRTLGGPFTSGVIAEQFSGVLDTTFGGSGVPGDVGYALLQADAASGVVSWKTGTWGVLTPPAPDSGNLRVCHVFVLYDMNRISAGASVLLEGVATESVVTVTDEEHGYVTGDYILISDVVFDEGDDIAIYEEDTFHSVTVLDSNRYTYTISGTFAVDSTATALVDNHITDARPLVGGGAGGGGGITWSTPVDANIVPNANNAWDLGDPLIKFKDGYFAGKLTVDGGIDPTYLTLTPTTAGSVPDGSFFLDSADSDKLKFKSPTAIVYDITGYNAPGVYQGTATGLVHGATADIDLTGATSGSDVNEGLIVKVVLTDGSALGAGEVLVEIFNDVSRAAATLVYSRVFDLADVPLIDVLPSHFEPTVPGEMYISITNNTGATGNFGVDVRVANIMPEQVPPTGGGSGIDTTTAGDGIKFTAGPPANRLDIDLAAISGLELTGSSPDKLLRVVAAPSGGITVGASGVATDTSVLRTSGSYTLTSGSALRFGSGSVFGLMPALTAGPPASGSYEAGDFYLDSNLVLWRCTVTGSPGSWELWGWTFSQGIDVGIAAGEDNATYTTVVAAGDSVDVEVSVTGRRGVIRKLNVWGTEDGFPASDLTQSFRVSCYPNEIRRGREQLWAVAGQIRKTYLTSGISGGLDDVVPVSDVSIASPDELARLRRLASVVGEEYGRIQVRNTGPASFELYEAVLNSFDSNDPFMLVTEAVELYWFNNSGTDPNKVFLTFHNDGATAIRFGYQLDIENIGGGAAY